MSRAWVQPQNGVQPTAAEKYGVKSTGDHVATLPTTIPSDEAHAAQPWHPDSPVFWLGALVLVTVGLAAGSTAIRIGPAKASLSVGNS